MYGRSSQLDNISMFAGELRGFLDAGDLHDVRGTVQLHQEERLPASSLHHLQQPRHVSSV